MAQINSATRGSLLEAKKPKESTLTKKNLTKKTHPTNGGCRSYRPNCRKEIFGGRGGSNEDGNDGQQEYLGALPGGSI